MDQAPSRHAGGRLKPALRELYHAATLCDTIAALTLDVERTEGEYVDALIAIRELAIGAHDRVDFALRTLTGDPGIGYSDPIRRALELEQPKARKTAAAARGNGSGAESAAAEGATP
jgi:hypothetical protein